MPTWRARAEDRAGFDRPGKRGPGRGGADFRKLFSVCHPAQRCADGGVPGIFPAAAGVVWSQRSHASVCHGLYEYLHSGNGVCGSDPVHEFLYHSAGLYENQYAFDFAGSNLQYCAGSGLYLWSGYGDPGSGAGHGALTGAVDDLDPVFPVREKTGGADPAAADPAGMEDSDSCLALGLSPFVMQITECALSICFNNSLLKYGGDIAVGAMSIFTTVMQIASLPMQGICQGAQPITGYNYGAGRWDRVRENFFLLVRTGVIFESAVWILILICPQIFIGIFTNDPELTAYCVRMIRIYFATLFVLSLQNTCQNTFLALGMQKHRCF